jgi:hypothetical protein
MASLGRHTKWTIGISHRDAVRRVLTEGLGLGAEPGPAPDFELFVTADDGRIGVTFVPDADALDADAQAKGVWLELVVDDTDARAAALERHGAKRLDYVDHSHAYFQVPGGPVFRLARR